MNKNLNIVRNGLNLVGTVILISSFFVEDNKKAVHRRWVALGTFTAAFGVHVINNGSVKAKKA